MMNASQVWTPWDLGFDWGSNKKQITFEQRLEDLEAYKEEHGHINVKESEDKSLYGFCKHIRNARNHPGKSKTLINEERIASLDALGFKWSIERGGMSCIVGDVVAGLERQKKQMSNSKHQNEYSKEFSELNSEEFAASISLASGNLKTKTAANQSLDQMREDCASKQSSVEDSNKRKIAEV